MTEKNFAATPLYFALKYTIGLKYKHMMTRREYINDFLYFVIKPDDTGGRGSLIYCSGSNLTRFAPLTKEGHYGLSSNPVIAGLQLVKCEVSSLATTSGAKTVNISGKDCAKIPPTMDTWYSEPLLIEGASESLPEEIINHCVASMLKRLSVSLVNGLHLPDDLSRPLELQEFLEDLCRQAGR
jgi:hypothetical protein